MLGTANESDDRFKGTLATSASRDDAGTAVPTMGVVKGLLIEVNTMADGGR